jgi:hypothetical protein
MIRVIVNFAAIHVGRDFVQNRGEHADQPCFGLTAQSKQDEIVARKNCVYDLRHDRILKTEDAGKKIFAALDFADQITAEFVFYGPVGESGF